LPGKTRVFIEFVIDNFRQLGYAQSFDATREKRVALPRRIGNAKR
jgi:hypothetical protein